MSAIWGMIDFKGDIQIDGAAERMKGAFRGYRLDCVEEYQGEREYFAYGGQYFTPQASYEHQPMVEESPGESLRNSGDAGRIIFSADAVLDNREELLERLGVHEQEGMKIADGDLMHRILNKYGQREGCRILLGIFAYARYDTGKEELTLAADPTGSRCLYYCMEQEKVYYSTLIQPILDAKGTGGEPAEFNYRFFTDYLAMNDLSLYTDAQETPFTGIYKVAPGHHVILSKEGINREKYWLWPQKEEKRGEQEVKEEIIRLFDQGVQGVLRAKGETGILLSSGLDSTSVACFAASKLKDMGKELFSYTSVPEKDFVHQGSPYYIVNERSGVEKTAAFTGNLRCKFLDLDGKNGFDDAEAIMSRLELPYKSLQNLLWIYEVLQEAAKDGCTMVLTGQYGNATISFGDFEMNFYTLLKKGRLLELKAEVDAYHSRYGTSRKAIYKDLLISFRREIFSRRVKEDKAFQSVYAKNENIKKYETGKRFRRKGIGSSSPRAFTLNRFRPYMAYDIALSQLGEFETKQSLITGVLLRDPTRDRRLIEYCMRLSKEHFIYRGTNRRLVRFYLKEFLPPEITEDYRHRGMQSADTVARVNRSWARISKECYALLEDELAERILDIEKLRKTLDSYQEGLPAENSFEALKILYSLLLIRYMKWYQKRPLSLEEESMG